MGVYVCVHVCVCVPSTNIPLNVDNDNVVGQAPWCGLAAN